MKIGKLFRKKEQVSEDEAIYETAAADEDIRARFHEAQAQENLAREMSKLSVTAMEEDIPEDEMTQTRALDRYQKRSAKVRFND